MCNQLCFGLIGLHVPYGACRINAGCHNQWRIRFIPIKWCQWCTKVGLLCLIHADQYPWQPSLSLFVITYIGQLCFLDELLHVIRRAVAPTRAVDGIACGAISWVINQFPYPENVASGSQQIGSPWWITLLLLTTSIISRLCPLPPPTFQSTLHYPPWFPKHFGRWIVYVCFCYHCKIWHCMIHSTIHSTSIQRIGTSNHLELTTTCPLMSKYIIIYSCNKHTLLLLSSMILPRAIRKPFRSWGVLHQSRA